MFGSLKWNWHRIRKAAVLTRAVDDRANGTFHVFVAKGAGFSSHPATACVFASEIHVKRWASLR